MAPHPVVTSPPSGAIRAADPESAPHGVAGTPLGSEPRHEPKLATECPRHIGGKLAQLLAEGFVGDRNHLCHEYVAVAIEAGCPSKEP